MNFYKKVQDQRVHNKNYQIVYIVRYIYFIKCQISLFYRIIDYEVFNKFISPKFLLILAKFQY